jgi:hypothetical protein
MILAPKAIATKQQYSTVLKLYLVEGRFVETLNGLTLEIKGPRAIEILSFIEFEMGYKLRVLSYVHFGVILKHGPAVCYFITLLIDLEKFLFTSSKIDVFLDGNFFESCRERHFANNKIQVADDYKNDILSRTATITV